MPMNERARAGFIGKLHVKSPACGEANSGKSVWTRKPEDLGLSIGLAWLLFYIAPHRDNKVTKS